MKKIMIGLTALMLMLSGLVCAWAEEAPVLLVQLPEDAQMVENVAFDDGDFVQTYQLNGGAYVQLLRYGDMSMSISDLVAGDWAGATSVQDMELKSLKKKFKDKHFAAGCDREVIKQGAEMLGWELDELLGETLEAMKTCEEPRPHGQKGQL